MTSEDNENQNQTETAPVDEQAPVHADEQETVESPKEQTEEPDKSEEPPEEPKENPHAELTRECKSPWPEDKPFDGMQYLAIAMSSAARFFQTMNESPNMEYDRSEQGRLWLEAIGQSATNFENGDFFESSLAREASLWRQAVEHEGEEITAARPRSKSSNNGPSQLSGDKAIFKLTNVLGLGTVVQIPLWHTGMWVSLKAPSDGELLELERSIAFEKIELGRHTNGMVFSNSSVYFINKLLNFVLAHVFDSSLKTNSTKALKREILVNDLPVLLWGMSCAIWPNGYPFSQPCTSDAEKCQHVTKETLNLSKLCWTDNQALTTKQRKHMVERGKKYQHDDFLSYQAEHIQPQSRVVKIHENLSVRLKVPTLDEYEASGFKWVDGIVQMVENSFSRELRNDERNQYINEQGRASALRQYGHWVSEIVISDGDNITDRDTIDSALDRISSDKDVTDKFFEQIGKFIDDSTVSLIAIPQYACPSCGGNQAGAHPRYPHLIPLGVAQVFFTLLGQRVQKILTS